MKTALKLDTSEYLTFFLLSSVKFTADKYKLNVIETYVLTAISLKICLIIMVPCHMIINKYIKLKVLKRTLV